MNTDDPRLTAYALGELDPPERAEIEALLQTNPEAAREVAEMRETAALVRAQLRTEEAPPLAPAQKQEILSEAASPRRAPAAPPASTTPWRNIWAPLAVAACAALMAGYGAMYLNTPKRAELPEAMPAPSASTDRPEQKDGIPAEPADAAPEAPAIAPHALATPVAAAAPRPTGGVMLPIPHSVSSTASDPQTSRVSGERKGLEEPASLRTDLQRNAEGVDKAKNAFEKQMQAPDASNKGNAITLGIVPENNTNLAGGSLATASKNQSAAPNEKPMAANGALKLDGLARGEGDRSTVSGNTPAPVTASSSYLKDSEAATPTSKLKLADASRHDFREALPAASKPESAPRPFAAAPLSPAPVDEARRGRAKSPDESAAAPAPTEAVQPVFGGATVRALPSGMAGRAGGNRSMAAQAGSAAQPLRPTASPTGTGLDSSPDGGNRDNYYARGLGSGAAAPQPAKDRKMELAEEKRAMNFAGDQPTAGAKESESEQSKKAVATKENRAALGFITVGGFADLPQQEPSNTEAYDSVTDNDFLTARDNRFSTFSIDVDTASYSNVRRFLTSGQRPPKGAVRIEELVNYFHYDYPEPKAGEPLSVSMEVAACPWTPAHRLLRIALKARELDAERRAHANLVFLIDVSGSMDEPNKLPLVKESLRLLVDKLGPQDTVAIAVYAGASGTVLEPTNDKEKIRAALDRLSAGGSTNGAAGIRLAYDLAKVRFDKANTNRVILATDGDFNVGVTNQSDLTDLITKKAKSGVFLTVLGFGYGNLKDSTMEKLADKGNGNYGYIDTIAEGRKILVEQMAGTLYTVAKDVKLQIDFNPAQVEAYRLIGYENRMLATKDFNDDTKDAGEIGAGHTVTALYEIVPAGQTVPGATEVTVTDPSKYQPALPAAATAPSPAVAENAKSVPASKASAELAADGKPPVDEMLTVKLRWKAPDGDVSTKREFPLTDSGLSWEKSSRDLRWAASVASFGMLLRDSPHKGQATWATTRELALEGQGKDADAHRIEFLELIGKAEALAK